MNPPTLQRRNVSHLQQQESDDDDTLAMIENHFKKHSKTYYSCGIAALIFTIICVYILSIFISVVIALILPYFHYATFGFYTRIALGTLFGAFGGGICSGIIIQIGLFVNQLVKQYLLVSSDDSQKDDGDVLLDLLSNGNSWKVVLSIVNWIKVLEIGVIGSVVAVPFLSIFILEWFSLLLWITISIGLLLKGKYGWHVFSVRYLNSTTSLTAQQQKQVAATLLPMVVTK